jgi:hypothetical protein
MSRKGLEKACFLPAYINDKSQPEVLKYGEPHFDEVVKYLRWSSSKLGTKFAVENDELIINPPVLE